MLDVQWKMAQAVMKTSPELSSSATCDACSCQSG